MVAATISQATVVESTVVESNQVRLLTLCTQVQV